MPLISDLCVVELFPFPYSSSTAKTPLLWNKRRPFFLSDDKILKTGRSPFFSFIALYDKPLCFVAKIRNVFDLDKRCHDFGLACRSGHNKIQSTSSVNATSCFVFGQPNGLTTVFDTRSVQLFFAVHDVCNKRSQTRNRALFVYRPRLLQAKTDPFSCFGALQRIGKGFVRFRSRSLRVQPTCSDLIYKSLKKVVRRRSRKNRRLYLRESSLNIPLHQELHLALLESFLRIRR